jgi:very-short-patch-repair endonuclease
MREAYLNERGWRVLRVKNYDVFHNLRSVEEAIWKALEPDAG